MNQGAFAAVINNGGEVLLVRSLTHREFDNHWSLPGGVAEKDESLEECAVREIIEETAIYCHITKLINVVDNVNDNIKVSIFEALYIKGEIKLQVSEIAEAKWFSFADALKLPLAFNTKEVLWSIK